MYKIKSLKQYIESHGALLNEGKIEDVLDEIEKQNDQFQSQGTDMSKEELQAFSKRLGELNGKLTQLRSEKGAIEKSIEKLQVFLSDMTAKKSNIVNRISANIATLKHDQFFHDKRMEENGDWTAIINDVQDEVNTAMKEIEELYKQIKEY